ncbi:30S ribosomal protein S2 [Candidatus Falkowbacteria bacterium]|uniref:Small ribosomal subunit protein uS2 n=1 Tax=Candidatus Falkowbacteria bacterium CG10_big_fil_rev_8_21_14_0_10_37_18 TaxID=1974562 RepID=A0A2H0VBJ9_9BACT|nr:30S ribosomal protein S2 [Candidatus Falkowbacteria bacterium]NCQ12502.1 30S ribosomal protein S2 [Candidatus Falkowbacteria bacterium]PIR95729.1 MAG: 30S ribosomal protein S2 [Candidatus Falkowbacteria bacterium CG10_big_fil_rev_8_21_14_0_10_37_18]
MINVPKLEDMLKAGMHFGHRTNRWHPKMKQFIFTSKNGIYIIDLRKSQKKLREALEFMAKLVSEGKNILFLGTKSQVSEPLKKMAKETGQSYIVGKWLGGYLTNFAMVKKSVKKYLDLTEKREAGKLEKYTKKERLDFDREIKKLEERVGGVSTLNKLPDALFVWDIREEETAIKEAQQKNIPIIAICDTNVNPEEVTYPIPANDDSTKTIELILESVKEAILEAKKNIKQ